ncbi:MAG TPA: M24 family metallopeptidase [Thermoanaerobaculia bacterium]|nr:M24 family metallopeptidase [Thermoanaerobaculia bacterium]
MSESPFVSRLPQIQQALADAGLDGWLFAVFQQNDPVSLDLLSLGGRNLVTRRCYYLIPREGTPKKLSHRLEEGMLDHLPGDKTLYLRWSEHREGLAALVAGCRRLAAQYSPGNELPAVSRLDAGTAELLAGAGVELVSSADLVQEFAATWTPDQLASHRRAQAHLHRIVREAFDRTGEALRTGTAIHEHEIQRFILESFERAGLWSEGDPIVAVDAHAADPHFETPSEGSARIAPGHLLLIDLWAKEKTPTAIYGDITWCGVCAASPTERQQEIWSIAAAARDAGIALVRERYPHTEIRGFEVDDATRAVIDAAGYGPQFIHRTGHSIGTKDHGQGANMDNLETHDTRRLLPMTGVSIEPGIYLPGELGVRTEVNIALTPAAAEVTGAEPQRDLLRLLA